MVVLCIDERERESRGTKAETIYGAVTTSALKQLLERNGAQAARDRIKRPFPSGSSGLDFAPIGSPTTSF